MLAHSVFFSLHDDSPAAIDRLVASCKTYLADHPGVVFFCAGTHNKELDRAVNDRGFDVALHVVFDGKPAHDAYQTAPSHLTFIAENKDNWKQVRIFDADVESA